MHRFRWRCCIICEAILGILIFRLPATAEHIPRERGEANRVCARARQVTRVGKRAALWPELWASGGTEKSDVR